MTARRAFLAAAVLGLLAVAGSSAYALINPNFTPVNLVEKSDLILLLKVMPPDDKSGRCTMEVVRCLKGRMPDDAQILDLSQAVNAEHARAVRQMIGDDKAGAPALLFVGKGEQDEPTAKLHLAGKWISLDRRARPAPVAPAAPPAAPK